MNQKLSASRRDEVAKIVPKLVECGRDVLFGDIWERPELSKRDRSLATLAVLITTSRPDQLKLHLAKGLENGLSRVEIGELITHLAFYAGWPSAMAAAHLAREVFEQVPE
jgi:4-carboxymuconolactone decarboxylase